MGSIHIAPASPDATIDLTRLAAMRWEAWSILMESLDPVLVRPSAEQVLSYGDMEFEHGSTYATPDGRGVWSFEFTDEQGNAKVGAILMNHWFDMALLLGYERLEKFVAPMRIVTPNPTVAMLQSDTYLSRPIIDVRGFYHIPIEVNAEGHLRLDRDLWGEDGAFIDDDALTDDERARSREALATTPWRCTCEVCGLVSEF